MTKTQQKKLCAEIAALMAERLAVPADGYEAPSKVWRLPTPYGVVDCHLYPSDVRGGMPWVAFSFKDWPRNHPYGTRWFGWGHWKNNWHVPTVGYRNKQMKTTPEMLILFAEAFHRHVRNFFTDQGYGFPFATHEVSARLEAA